MFVFLLWKMILHSSGLLFKLQDGKRVFWLGAGVTVSQAIEYFREENMALGDNGGWTGQTVVGALNTGTHGTDLNLPPSSDFVRAVHFVMSNGQEVVFEPTSSSRFQVGDFGDNVTLVQDDDEFYSSVVTIGSLGIAVRILYEPLPYYYVFNQMVSTLDSSFKHFQSFSYVLDGAPSQLATRKRRFMGILH